MRTYYVNEAAFALPEKGFIDRTLHRLQSPLDGEDPLAVEIRRQPIETGKSLRQLVDADVQASKDKGNGYTLVDEAEVVLASAPAIVLRARLRARDAVYYQMQAHVVCDKTWISISVTGPSTERAACEETFERIVRSVAWRSS